MSGCHCSHVSLSVVCISSATGNCLFCWQVVRASAGVFCFHAATLVVQPRPRFPCSAWRHHAAGTRAAIPWVLMALPRPLGLLVVRITLVLLVVSVCPCIWGHAAVARWWSPVSMSHWCGSSHVQATYLYVVYGRVLLHGPFNWVVGPSGIGSIYVGRPSRWVLPVPSLDR